MGTWAVATSKSHAVRPAAQLPQASATSTRTSSGQPPPPCATQSPPEYCAAGSPSDGPLQQAEERGCQNCVERKACHNSWQAMPAGAWAHTCSSNASNAAAQCGIRVRSCARNVLIGRQLTLQLNLEVDGAAVLGLHAVWRPPADAHLLQGAVRRQAVGATSLSNQAGSGVRGRCW